MSRVSTWVPVLLPESVTSTVNVTGPPPPDGVPEITPVEEFRLAQDGSDPLLMLHVYPVPVPPPLSVSVWE